QNDQFREAVNTNEEQDCRNCDNRSGNLFLLRHEIPGSHDNDQIKEGCSQYSRRKKCSENPVARSDFFHVEQRCRPIRRHEKFLCQRVSYIESKTLQEEKDQIYPGQYDG